MEPLRPLVSKEYRNYKLASTYVYDSSVTVYKYTVYSKTLLMHDKKNIYTDFYYK